MPQISNACALCFIALTLRARQPNREVPNNQRKCGRREESGGRINVGILGLWKIERNLESVGKMLKT
jgi:hypothetical protein